MSLMLIKSGGRLIGGSFNITVDLDLTTDERTQLVAALRKRLMAESPPQAQYETVPVPEPELLSPDWIEGMVTLKLTDDLRVLGTPSMAGTNRCTLSLDLNAQQAQAMNKAFANDLAEAQIEYQTQVVAAGTGTRSRLDDILREAHLHTNVTVNISTSDASRHSLTLRGHLDIPNASRYTQTITM